MNLRGCKGSRVKGSAEVQIASCSSQFAVAVHSCSSLFAVTSVSQIMQVNVVTSQTLTLRGNECLNFVEVWKGLYTEVYDYFLSNPKHVRDVLLNLPMSSCVS